jgi:hypothetical protein
MQRLFVRGFQQEAVESGTKYATLDGGGVEQERRNAEQKQLYHD